MNNSNGDYMNNYSVYAYHNDLEFNRELINQVNDSNVNILVNKKGSYVYKTIFFNNKKYDGVRDTLVKEINYFFRCMNISNSSHIFVVGLGNDNYTADSVGCKALKYIKVNSYLANFGINIDGALVSAMEPGVLGETGILTEKTILSMTKEIRPDLVILIDSFVSDDINYLNKTIEINNMGIKSGSGINGLSSIIDKELLGVPVLAIGVSTASLVRVGKDNISYVLTTKDIDKYVNDISKVVGLAINEAIMNL